MEKLNLVKRNFKNRIPELIKTLCKTGHGDEIDIANGSFPSANLGGRNIRPDGISKMKILDAAMPLSPLDTYYDPNMILMRLMTCDEGKINSVIWDEYEKTRGSQIKM